MTTTPGPADPIPADAPTVLLVEDSSVQRRLVTQLIEKSGPCRVVTAADGVAALEVMARITPDIVLTDLYMPNMDGLALVERVREVYPHIPVVLMTAQGSEQVAVAALRAGAADYVPKKTLAGAVGPTLERVLANARAETHRQRLLSGMSGRISRFSLDNDSGLVGPLVAQLRDDLQVLGVCDRNETTRVAIALEEALLNAIYHGNLEVSSELKANGDGPFRRQVEERRHLDPYRIRRVRVISRVTPQKATFVITDQGPGFDVTKLPDPTDPEYLERPSGRGLLLMRAFMDEVRYNPTGNQVTLVKLRTAK